MRQETLPKFVLERLNRDRQYVGVVDGKIVYEGQWHPNVGWQASPEADSRGNRKEDIEVYSCDESLSAGGMRAVREWGYKKVVFVSRWQVPIQLDGYKMVKCLFCDTKVRKDSRWRREDDEYDFRPCCEPCFNKNT